MYVTAKRSGRRPLLVALLTGLGAVAADSVPASRPASACLYLPPALEDRVVYYQSFEGDLRTPQLNRIGAETAVTRGTAVPGVSGNGLQVTDGKDSGPLVLRSPALSPAKPLTISLWWRLDAPMAAETCFHLLALRGRGMVANFVRGRGEWCALQEPTYVFQVVYYEGIPDINGIWHGTVWTEPGQWHHVAMVFANAMEIDVYWDGSRRSHYAIRGRSFVAADGGSIEIGPNWLFHPMTVDEVLVIDRALTGDEIAAYVQAVRQLSAIGWPVFAPAGASPQ